VVPPGGPIASPGVREPGVAAEIVLEGDPAEPAPARATGATRGAGPDAPPDPLRWHAEWRGDTLRLWLGADQTRQLPVEQLARQVLRELHRRLAARGCHLASLVCNGQLLWRREQPSPLLEDRIDPPPAEREERP
jgi:hypothetical protein